MKTYKQYKIIHMNKYIKEGVDIAYYVDKQDATGFLTQESAETYVTDELRLNLASVRLEIETTTIDEDEYIHYDGKWIPVSFTEQCHYCGKRIPISDIWFGKAELNDETFPYCESHYNELDDKWHMIRCNKDGEVIR